MASHGRRFGGLLLIAASLFGESGQAQAQMQMYVCQTPQFWCAFPYAPGVPSGTVCHCNSWAGPVVGYSINPNQAAAPTYPQPQAYPQPQGYPYPAQPQQQPYPYPTQPQAQPYPAPQPQPQTGSQTGQAPTGNAPAPANSSDDCFRGLGNCQGQFRR